MRTLLAVLVLVACAPSESLPATCSPACAAGQVCVNAQCLVPADSGADAARDVAAVDVPAADASADVSLPDGSCPPMLAFCGMGYCADLATDRNHCGLCTMRCSPNQNCENFQCVLMPGADPHCSTLSQTYCNMPGTEAACWNLQSSAQNCGACGHACPASAPVCFMGRCAESADAG